MEFDPLRHCPPRSHRSPHAPLYRPDLPQAAKIFLPVAYPLLRPLNSVPSSGGSRTAPTGEWVLEPLFVDCCGEVPIGSTQREREENGMSTFPAKILVATDGLEAAVLAVQAAVDLS